MSPKRSASASPEPNPSSSDASRDSSSDGEQLPAQQTTRSGRTSRPPNRHVPSPGKLFSDANEEAAARRASGEAAAAKRQRAAQRAKVALLGPRRTSGEVPSLSPVSLFVHVARAPTVWLPSAPKWPPSLRSRFLQAGAARVYAVEASGIARFARVLAESNGCGGGRWEQARTAGNVYGLLGPHSGYLFVCRIVVLQQKVEEVRLQEKVGRHLRSCAVYTCLARAQSASFALMLMQ
jgi:hypothetical protein